MERGNTWIIQVVRFAQHVCFGQKNEAQRERENHTPHCDVARDHIQCTVELELVPWGAVRALSFGIAERGKSVYLRR